MTTTPFAEWLEATMVKRKLTQGSIAVYAGVDTSAVSRWRRGSAPKPANLRRLAEALHVPVEDILRLAGYLPPLEPEPRALRETPSPYDGEIAEIVRDLDEESKRRVAVIARALLDDMRQQLN